MTTRNSTSIHKDASIGHAYTYYPIIIIGAGETGIAMGCQLKQQLGFDQFRIFERQSHLGGTWYSNRYPGVRCDIPTVFYSYSFALNHHWSRFHPAGPEIREYLGDVAEKYKIVDKMQFDTEVTELRYLEDEKLWEATLAHLVPGVGDVSNKERLERLRKDGPNSVYVRQEIVRAKIAVSAVGGLVEPNAWPDQIPGIEKFQGDHCHTARWNDKIDIRDKDVVVIGAGCSAAQVVPALVEAPYHAKSVTQIIRTPPWVLPLPTPVSQGTYDKYAPKLYRTIPGLARLIRFLIFLESEKDFLYHIRLRPGNVQRQKDHKEKLLRHLRSKAPEEYLEMLTPHYNPGCKRRIIGSGWLESLHHPKINITTQPVQNINADSVTLGRGRTYPKTPMSPEDEPKEKTLPADVIVLANGFEVGTWIHPLKIVGRGGRDLGSVWDERGGSQAYMGTAMDGFPNAFILFGPNTATGHSSVILASENMVNYSLKFIKMILNGDVDEVEVKKEAEMSWTKMVQEKVKDTVYQSGGCASWYKGADGWNATVYPFCQTDFTYRCMFPKWGDWDLRYTPKGQRRLKLRRLMNFVIFILAIALVPSLYKGVMTAMRMLPSSRVYLQSFAPQQWKQTVNVMRR